jgi:hypothetical protein
MIVYLLINKQHYFDADLFAMLECFIQRYKYLYVAHTLIVCSGFLMI